MFITKKKYEEALNKVKCEIEEQCEKRMYEAEKRVWEEQEKFRMREDYDRRFADLEKRIRFLEKNAGFTWMEDDVTCPFAPKPHY